MRENWVLPVVLVIGMVLAGCATTASLPPMKPIQDVKVLAGEWGGWVTVNNQNVQAKLVIKEDGSYVGGPMYGVGNPITGSIYQSGDQVLYKSSRPSNGTVTLYEGAGQRVLRFTSTDGALADFTPIK